ncbi:hypothetical protein WJX75_003421 [Coccomyxa subellipsoidea]|uniref:Uncharacterized protein n=1 Tax=Coccomyxa subellipsoidea TaxID=248742 RepID=A0ABR2YVN1_9CHLO
MAAQIVQEADWLQQQMVCPCPILQGADLRASDAADQMTASVSRPFLLNLHGLSQSAARIALVQRLDYLTFTHIQHTLPSRKGEEQYANFSGRIDDAQKRGGRRRTAISSQANADPEARDCCRAGQADDALRRYVEAQKESQFKSRFFHMAGVQYLLVALGLSAVLSAMYVVPLILDHAL